MRDLNRYKTLGNDMDKTTLFDTHAHLYDPVFENDLEEVLERSQELGGLILVGSDLNTSKTSLALARKSTHFFSTAGIHPHEASSVDLRKEMNGIAELFEDSKVVACGEMGLDYYYDHSPRKTQIEVFERQLQFAKEKNLPCVIHIRDAFSDFFTSIDKIGYYCGVVHCFTGNQIQAEECLRRGYFLSFGGLLTFKNAKEVQDVMIQTPMDRILAETDCPWMSPTPFRGQRNEPVRVQLIIEQIARLREVKPETVAEKTFQNAISCFHLGALL